VSPSRSLHLALTAALAVSLAAPRAALAGEEAAAASAVRTYPYRALAQRSLTLPAARLALELPVQVNLSRGAEGKPWSLPASLDYGVTDDLQLGLFHALGLCIGGPSDGCRTAYDDVGGRVRLGVYRDLASQLVLQGSVLARRFDDLDLSGSVGAAYKRSMGSFAIVVQLDLGIAANGRARRLYDELLVGSLEGQWQASEGLAVFALLGAAKALQVLSPYQVATAIPVAIGLELEPTHRLNLGAQLSFPDLAGKSGGAGTREGRGFLRLYF
jgi:hypothetical protein